MSIKELAYGVIDTFSEEKLRAFLTLFADENTLMQAECDHITNNSDKSKSYDSINELIDDITKNNN